MWPPAGLAEAVLRQFNGNDFDPHLRWGAEIADREAPVTVSGDGQRDLPVIVNVHQPPADPLRTIPLVAVDDPGVTADAFAVVGDVSYGGVAADTVDGFGFLELVSDFETGGPIVTRAVASSGPMRLITGRSGERPFALPVQCGSRRPIRVRVNLILSGTGTVTLTNLRMTQYARVAPTAGPATLVSSPPPWWARGGFTGTAAGGFGLVGFFALAEPLMRRGRGRAIVLSAVIAVGLLGQVYFGWAMAVVGHGEPLRAWGPLLACAVAGWCVPASIPVVNRRYRAVELRRMQALDAVAV